MPENRAVFLAKHPVVRVQRNQSDLNLRHSNGLCFKWSFDPRTVEQQLLRAAMHHVAEAMHRRVRAIRHPEVGEFATVVVSGVPAIAKYLRDNRMDTCCSEPSISEAALAARRQPSNDDVTGA